MTDIVGRLGASIVLNEWGRIDKALRDDTIAEIERLRARLAEATKEIERAALAFELLARADDTQRNGVTPSVRAQDLRAFLAKEPKP